MEFGELSMEEARRLVKLLGGVGVVRGILHHAPQLKDPGQTAKYPDVTMGQIEAFLNMVGGEQKIRHILAGHYSLQLVQGTVPWSRIEGDEIPGWSGKR